MKKFLFSNWAKRFTIGLLSITLLLMTACANDDQSTDNTVVDEAAELIIEDLTVGDGAVAEDGNELEVHYVGTLTDGTQFDSSRDRDATFSFTLGAGQVIEGWDEGMKGMAIGGLRKLTIPADMAYGDSAVGSIPAGSTLIFEVELIGIE